MTRSDNLLALHQRSQFIDTNTTAEPFRDLRAEGLFQKPTFVQEDQASTVNYHYESSDSSTSQHILSDELTAKALDLFEDFLLALISLCHYPFILIHPALMSKIAQKGISYRV